MDSATFAFFITCLISVLAIINPLSTVGLFLSLTKNQKEKEANRIAFMSSITAMCVLLFFAITGFLVFQIYSITIEAFRIAGGLVLLIIGIRMLFPGDSKASGLQKGVQVYIVPLAVPMTSGPGAITTTIVLASQVASVWQEFALWVAIFLACAINYLVLRFSEAIHDRFGEEGLAVMIKIMGLLVCSIGVQFMINGLKAAFPLLA